MSRYGRRVYDDSTTVKSETVGKYVCPICHEASDLISRKGPGFQAILSVCQSKHTCMVTKTLYEKYHVGDRIRLYGSTFGKDSVVRLDSYYEGVITRSYPSITDYEFDFVVDKCVMNDKEILPPAWVIGHLYKGVRHSSRTVLLLKKAIRTNGFEQLSQI